MLAAITIEQILGLLGVAIAMHAVLLAPLVVAILGAIGERGENQEYLASLGRADRERTTV